MKMINRLSRMPAPSPRHDLPRMPKLPKLTKLPILLLLLIGLAASPMLLTACSGKQTARTIPGTVAGTTAKQTGSETADLHDYQRSEQATDFVALVTDQDQSAIIIQLYPEKAPLTVENFQKLVGKGFYNNLTFHRVVPGFVIQGGDPSGDGSGGPGYSIKGEFISNGVNNDLKHTRGVISMARSGKPDSAGSQFFICVAAASSLDGDYAAFGKVQAGMETVDRIVKIPNSGSPSNRPTTCPIIQEAFFVTPPAS